MSTQQNDLGKRYVRTNKSIFLSPTCLMCLYTKIQSEMYCWESKSLTLNTRTKNRNQFCYYIGLVCAHKKPSILFILNFYINLPNVFNK